MSQGKGDRNRSTGPNYSANYNNINWDNKKKLTLTDKGLEEYIKSLGKPLEDAMLDRYRKEYIKLNCIASDKCQANTETKE